MPKRNRSKKNVLKNISDASLKKLIELKKKLLKGGEGEGEGEGAKLAAMGATTGSTTKVDSEGMSVPVTEDIRDRGAMAIQPAEGAGSEAAGEAGAKPDQSWWDQVKGAFTRATTGGKSRRRNRNNNKRNNSKRNRKQNSKKRN
jgi:hypothetical protein